jgi:putative hemolysin
VDEYGGTEGLVAVRDILDEIVKELEDEYDDGESRINALRPSEAIMDATVTIDELNEMFGVDIKENGFDTVGGLVFTQLGRIPTVGDRIEVGQIGVSVLSTLGKRIKRVKVNKI